MEGDLTKQWDDFLAIQPEEYFAASKEEWITEEERKAFASFDLQLRERSDTPLQHAWDAASSDVEVCEASDITKSWDVCLAKQPPAQSTEPWISEQEKDAFEVFDHQLRNGLPLIYEWEDEPQGQAERLHQKQLSEIREAKMQVRTQFGFGEIFASLLDVIDDEKLAALAGEKATKTEMPMENKKVRGMRGKRGSKGKRKLNKTHI